jgi:hypothetical protein
LQTGGGVVVQTQKLPQKDHYQLFICIAVYVYN